MRLKVITLIAAAWLAGTAGFAQDKSSLPSSYNFNRGMEAAENQKPDEALEYFNKEVEANPKDGYAYTWIAILRNYKEEYGKGLTAVNLAIKNLPRKDKYYCYTAYAVRAEIYCNLGDTVKALADYGTALGISPEEDGAYRNRAEIYYAQGKYDLSDADYRRLISLDQGDASGYMGLGRNRFVQQLWDEAVEQFDFAEKLDPEFSQVYAFRAECYLGKKDWDKATDDLLSALKIDGNQRAFLTTIMLDEAPLTRMVAKLKILSAKEPTDAKWPYILGYCHERKKQYRQALRFYQEANEREVSSAVLERMAICYEEMGQFENALVLVDKALAMEPEEESTLSLKANLLYEVGRRSEAIAQWDSILAQRPEYAWGYYRRGWFKEKTDPEGAIEDLTLSITLNPEYAYSYVSRGDAYSRLGKKELARADYEKVVELENEPAQYATSQYAYLGLGRPEKAMEVADTIMARNPDDAGTFYDAACLYSRLGQTDKAMEFLEKSLRLGYKRFGHMQNDADMDSLRELPAYKELIRKYQEKARGEQDDLGDSGQDESLPAVDRLVEVPFTKESGSSLCRVKCSINELPLYFIFDTGASDVSLSQVEATFMMKNGYLDKGDVLGSSYFQDAVGNVSVGTVVNLKKVDFGGLELTNVKASVVQNQKAPLLLGQTVLGRLGKIEIDNAKHVLRISGK